VKSTPFAGDPPEELPVVELPESPPESPGRLAEDPPEDGTVVSERFAERTSRLVDGSSEVGESGAGMARATGTSRRADKRAGLINMTSIYCDRPWNEC
jgi:hypothetical protein